MVGEIISESVGGIIPERRATSAGIGTSAGPGSFDCRWEATARAPSEKNSRWDAAKTLSATLLVAQPNLRPAAVYFALQFPSDAVQYWVDGAFGGVAIEPEPSRLSSCGACDRRRAIYLSNLYGVRRATDASD
jgi:hypothetical protein